MEEDTRQKRCSACHEYKDLSEFNRSKSKAHTLGRTNRCRACSFVYMQQWRSTHKEHQKQYNKAYDRLHPERVVKRLAPLKKREEEDPEWYRNALREWSKRHPGYGARAWHKRENRLKEASTERHTPQQWRDLLASYGGKCAACGATENVHKDHIVPVAKGGHDGIDNLQPLCEACNRKKWLRTIDYRQPAQLEMDF